MTAGAELVLPAPVSGQWMKGGPGGIGVIWQAGPSNAELPANTKATFGLRANRPTTLTAGDAGYEFFATDVETLYSWDGAAWHIVGGVVTPAIEDAWSQIGGWCFAEVNAGTNTGTYSNNRMAAYRGVVPFPVTVDQFSVEVTTAGDPTGSMRCAIYANDRSLGYSRPGALVLDMGNSTALSSTGTFVTNIAGGAYAWAPGIYWIASNSQNPGGNPTMRNISPDDVGGPGRSTAGTQTGESANGTTGQYNPMPANFPNVVSIIGAMRVGFHRSA